MNRAIITTILSLGVIVNTNSQTPLFHFNNKSNLELLNWAFSGSHRCPSLGLNYVHHGEGEYGQYNTVALNCSQHINRLSGSLGGSILYDNADRNNQFFSANGIYTFQLLLGRRLSLRTSAKAGYNSRVVRMGKIADRYDMENYTTDHFFGLSNRQYFNWGISTLLFSQRSFIGVSVDNIHEPVEAKLGEAEYKLPRAYALLAGTRFHFTNFSLNPIAFFRTQGPRYVGDSSTFFVGPFTYAGLNVNLLHKKLIFGLGATQIFNRSTVPTGQVGYKLFNNSSVTYSLGFSKNPSKEVIVQNTSTHQLSIEWNFNCKPKKRRFRTISCPSFGGGTTGFCLGSFNKSKLSHSGNSTSGVAGELGGEKLKAGTLTAAQLNDFAKWELWSDIANDELVEYRKNWDLRPLDRYPVEVHLKDGRPLVDATVILRDKKGNSIWRTRTDNMGKAELWAGMMGKDNRPSQIEVLYKGEVKTLDNPSQLEHGVNRATFDQSCSVPSDVDILFALDATGSMGDEMEFLKVELKDIMKKVSKSDGTITMRVGAMVYRCLDDSYVTRKSPFSSSVVKAQDFLARQEAAGGGLEAVEVALDEAINDYQWSNEARTRLLFLILDEAPGTTNNIVKSLHGSIRLAAERGIKIIPLIASGTGYNPDKSLEYLMRSLALATNGTYAFLTDHSGVGNEHTVPTTDQYDVELLNAMMIRLIKENIHVPSCSEVFPLVGENQEDTVTVNIVEHVIVDSSLVNSEEPPAEELTLEEPKEDKPEPEQSNIRQVQKKFLYYPNPTSGVLTVEIEGKINYLFLSDLTGKVIQRYEMKDRTRRQIDLSDYTPGVYLLQYHSGNRTFSGRVVITR